MPNNEYRMTRAGWICAAVVMALFGLQQVFPLCERLMLSGRDGLAMKAVHTLTCQFVHGNLLHAATNALAFICLFYGLRREFSGAVLLFGFIAGWIATALFAAFLIPQNVTLVGSSGIIYGVLGVFTASEPFSKWRFCGVGSIPLIILAPVLVAADGLIALLFAKCLAWPVHTVAFAIGAGLVVAVRAARKEG
jgi:membrane associated rhomboid family serine protease